MLCLIVTWFLTTWRLRQVSLGQSGEFFSLEELLTPGDFTWRKKKWINEHLFTIKSAHCWPNKTWYGIVWSHNGVIRVLSLVGHEGCKTVNVGYRRTPSCRYSVWSRPTHLRKSYLLCLMPEPRNETRLVQDWLKRFRCADMFSVAWGNFPFASVYHFPIIAWRAFL